MTTSQPSVSFCIPAYNAERTLGRCLASVASQGLDDAEVLLIDNCSEDRTVEIAEQCLQGVARARILRNERNLGRVENWNRCLQEAAGRYVKFVLTNDVLLPGAVATLLEAVSSDDSVVMACSRPRFVNEMPNPLPRVSLAAPSIRRSTVETLEFFAKQGFLTGSLNGMIYRRAPLAKNRIFFRGDFPYFADYYHAIELAEHGAAVFVDAETFCFDASATGRYHFVGLKEPLRFFLENRQCVLLLKGVLQRYGCDARYVFDYLYGRYLWYLGQGARLSPLDTVRIFSGEPGLLCRAFAKTFWFRVKHRLAAHPRTLDD